MDLRIFRPECSAGGKLRRMDVWEAYRRTRYRVRTGEGEHVLRVDAQHPGLDAWLSREAPEARTWAFITAWNPGAARPERAENERAQADLRAYIERGSWPLWDACGSSEAGDHEEPSLFVAGISGDEALELAARFGQWAILFGEVGGTAQLLPTRCAPVS